jgi:hypothetical protein
VTAVVELQVAASTDAWERIGLRVVDGISWIGGVRLRFVPVVDGVEGVLGWTLVGCPGRPVSIDGLPTTHLDDELDQVAPESWQHEFGEAGFDHVVVMTSSLERTCGAITYATGEPLKRIREAGPIRQGFHRLGPAIVEVVESDRVTADTASFWGFVAIIDDLHDLAGRLGPSVMSMPKSAVQPGRFISSVRADVGLGLPFALMSR